MAEAKEQLKNEKKSAEKNNEKKQRPTRYLPTDRIQFTRQLDLLRAWGIASLPEGKPVTNKEVAAVMGMAETTTSLANPFFIDAGLLSKGDSGFTPSQEVLEFARNHQWNPDTAPQRLAPRLANSWFAQAVVRRASLQPIDRDEAIQLIATQVNAGPEYRGQITTILEYLEVAGVVQREGNQIRSSADGVVTVSPQGERVPMSGPTERESARPAVTTSFAKPTAGLIQIHVDVKADMAEIAGWAPDRISAFFQGIAAVLAAKGQVEKEASES